MIQAVLFDMDGTMADTEILWKKVNSKLAGMYGHTFDDELRKNMTGRKEDDALTLFKNFYHIETSVDELRKIRKEMLFQHIADVSANPGLYELLDLLDEHKIKKAVATSTFLDFASKVLEAINVEDRFEVIITGDKIQNGKPNPEMYLKAAQAVQTDPANCLVLEDAQNGVEAAVNAKMKVIAIPNELTKNHDFSKATTVVSSLKDIDWSLISSF